MAGLSLGNAWNEATAFVKREGRLLFPIGFLLVALPIAVATAMIPQPAPGRPPEPGAWMGLVPLAILIGMVGQVAIACLALRPGCSVGEALGRGARRFPAVLGAYLLVSLACAFAIILFAVVAALIVPGAAATPPNPQTAGLFFALLLLFMLPVFLFVWTRMLLVNAAAAAEEGGPIALLKRSWRLTGPHFWTLLGFVLLSVVLAFVVSFAVERVLGIAVYALAGPTRPGSLSAVAMLLISAAINTLITVFLTVMAARIYAQIVPDSKAEVFA